jgi:hypothetical protein
LLFFPSGICPEDLSLFLESQFKGMKVKKLTLGVAEPKLGAAITEALAIACNHIGPIPEILRGLYKLYAYAWIKDHPEG